MNFKKHVNFARKLGGGFQSEDIVQEAYIRCLKNGAIDNECYVYLSIRSVAFDFYRAKKNVIKVELEDVFIDEETEYIEPVMYEDVKDLLSDLHWFDQEIFKLYATKIKSIRKLAKETNISEKTIFESIKKCKQKLITWQKENQNQKDLAIQ